MWIQHQFDREERIETIGTQYLGAPVKVKQVEIALQEGRGTLKELEIGNPPGYTGAYAMRFGTVGGNGSDAIERRTDRSEADHDRWRSRRCNRQYAERHELPRAVVECSGVEWRIDDQLIVDKLDVTNTQASVSSPLLTRALEVNVPDEHLTDIGRSSNGVDVGTVIAQVLAPITKAVTRSMTEAGMKELGVDPNRLKSDAAQRMRDTLQSLGHPTN